MRRRAFNVWVVISLVFVAVVVTGLFSSAASMKYSNYPAAVPPIHRLRIFKLYRGQVEIITYHYPPGSAMVPVPGNTYEFIWDGIYMPGGRAIAGFEVGFRPPGNPWNPPGTTEYYIAFPIWPLAVPFLIAPVWWLRDWQRKRRERLMDSSRAFPVGFER